MAKFKKGDILYSDSYKEYCKIFDFNDLNSCYKVSGFVRAIEKITSKKEYTFTQEFIEGYYDFATSNAIDIWEELNNVQI